MLARFSIGNSNSFNFKRPFTQPNETFCAAISWAVSPYVYRYKLSEDIGELLYFPLLVNQQIGPNAYLEIWDVEDESLAATDEDWELRVSKLVLPSLCEPCQNNEESVTLTEITGETLPPYQDCNPFCSPLCT